MERILYHYKIAHQDVENFNENMIFFSSHHVLENIGISKFYFHLLWIVTSCTFIFHNTNILDLGYDSSHYKYTTPCCETSH